MAGRPRTMFRRVDALKARAHDLGDDLLRTMPEMYQKRQHNPTDPVGTAWVEAMGGVADAYLALKALAGLLEKKIKDDEAEFVDNLNELDILEQQADEKAGPPLS